MNQELKTWNQLATQQDEIYHLCAKRSGLPDAQFWLLYAICERKELLCQNAFCESWCYSKQTVSAATALHWKSRACVSHLCGRVP